jgi:DNA-directed RNA polymerase specialized sigma24 family protein
MSEDGSVTLWLGPLKDGDEAAIRKLWHEYYERLVALARAKLRGVRRRAADEEDVALSAFDSFCRGAEAGRFPQLGGRDDLWRLLVTLTARKAHDLAQAERRLKRGGGRVRGDSVFAPTAGDTDRGWAEVAGTEPTPEFAAQAAEECRRLLALLDNDELRSIAVWKMEGLTNPEIAARLGCAVPTVERRLRLIRKTWVWE